MSRYQENKKRKELKEESQYRDNLKYSYNMLMAVRSHEKSCLKKALLDSKGRSVLLKILEMGKENVYSVSSFFRCGHNNGEANIYGCLLQLEGLLNSTKDSEIEGLLNLGFNCNGIEYLIKSGVDIPDADYYIKVYENDKALASLECSFIKPIIYKKVKILNYDFMVREYVKADLRLYSHGDFYEYVKDSVERAIYHLEKIRKFYGIKKEGLNWENPKFEKLRQTFSLKYNNIN